MSSTNQYTTNIQIPKQSPFPCKVPDSQLTKCKFRRTIRDIRLAYFIPRNSRMLTISITAGCAGRQREESYGVEARPILSRGNRIRAFLPIAGPRPVPTASGPSSLPVSRYLLVFLPRSALFPMFIWYSTLDRGQREIWFGKIAGQLGKRAKVRARSGPDPDFRMPAGSRKTDRRGPPICRAAIDC